MVLLPGCPCCGTSCSSPVCQDICPYWVEFVQPVGFTVAGYQACIPPAAGQPVNNAIQFYEKSATLSGAGLPACGTDAAPWIERTRRRVVTARFDRRYRYKPFTTIVEAPTGDLVLSLVSQVTADRDLETTPKRCVSGRLMNAQARFDFRFGCNLDEETPLKQRLKISMRLFIEIKQSVVSSEGRPHVCDQYVPGGSYMAHLAANPQDYRETTKTWDSQNLTPEQYAAVFVNVQNSAYCLGIAASDCGQHFDGQKEIEIGWSGITGILPDALPWHSENTVANFGNTTACFNAYSNEKLRIKIGRFATCENPLP